MFGNVARDDIGLGIPLRRRYVNFRVSANPGIYWQAEGEIGAKPGLTAATVLRPKQVGCCPGGFSGGKAAWRSFRVVRFAMVGYGGVFGTSTTEECDGSDRVRVTFFLVHRPPERQCGGS